MSRYEVLDGMLTLVEAFQRFFSKNQASIEPQPGLEKPWENMRERAEVIRDMMKDVRYGGKEK